MRLAQQPKWKVKLKSQLESMTGLYKLAQICNVVTGLIAGVYVNKWTGVDGAKDPTTWRTYLIYFSIWAFISLLFLFFTLSAEKPLSEFLVEFDNLETEKQELVDRLEVRDINQTRLNDALYVFGLSVALVQRYKTQPADTLEKMCEEVMEPWVRTRENIFNFHLSKNLWNFTIYKVEGSGENKILKKLWRRNHELIVCTNRQWKAGEGHIGRCYMEERLIISPETQEIEAAQHVMSQSRPVNNGRLEDESYYNSFITTPIVVNNLPVGVLALTSSELSHFHKDDHELIVDTLGILLGLSWELCQQGGRNGRKRTPG